MTSAVVVAVEPSKENTLPAQILKARAKREKVRASLLRDPARSDATEACSCAGTKKARPEEPRRVGGGVAISAGAPIASAIVAAISEHHNRWLVVATSGPEQKLRAG